MKSIFTRFNLIVGPAALVLLTLCLLQTQARGQGSNVYTVTFNGGLAGLAPGQTLRVTQANLMELEGRRQNPVEVFGRVRLYDSQGGVIAESAEVKIPLKEFRSFNFDRNDLHLAGEPGTGRLQVRVEVQYRLFSIVDRTQIPPDNFPTSLELINETGHSMIAILLPAVQKIRDSANRAE